MYARGVPVPRWMVTLALRWFLTSPSCETVIVRVGSTPAGITYNPVESSNSGTSSTGYAVTEKPSSSVSTTARRDGVSICLTLQSSSYTTSRPRADLHNLTPREVFQ